MLKLFAVLACFILSPVLLADDSEYDKVRDKVFWLKLYDEPYKTFYCDEEKLAGERVTLEHVYPADWIAKALGCKSRKSCDNDVYRAASSDLHNLWPAKQRYNSSRGNKSYGVIPGETPRFKNDTCDFERTSGKNAVVEPRDAIKGQIARSILHMIHYYDLPSKDLLPLMVKWHIKYPPTPEEIARQDEIEELQGRRNEFIKGI